MPVGKGFSCRGLSLGPWGAVPGHGGCRGSLSRSVWANLRIGTGALGSRRVQERAQDAEHRAGLRIALGGTRCPQVARWALADLGVLGLASIRGCCGRSLAEPDAPEFELAPHRPAQTTPRAVACGQPRRADSPHHTAPWRVAVGSALASARSPASRAGSSRPQFGPSSAHSPTSGALAWGLSVQGSLVRAWRWSACACTLVDHWFLANRWKAGRSPFWLPTSRCFMHKRCYASFWGCLTTHDRDDLH